MAVHYWSITIGDRVDRIHVPANIMIFRCFALPLHVFVRRAFPVLGQVSGKLLDFGFRLREADAD